MDQIKDKISNLANAWEHYKAKNDERLEQLEKKSSIDPITMDQIRKIGNSMDEYKSAIAKMELASKRPNFISNNQENEEDSEYKQAFLEYVRKGNEYNLPKLELKSLSGVDSSAGYSVTQSMGRAIADNMTKYSVMRNLASIQEISCSSFDFIDSTNEFSTIWSSGEDAIANNNENIIRKIIKTYDLVSQPKASQKLLEDETIDIESWLGEKLAKSFASSEDNAFINGDGVNKPRGILNYTTTDIAHINSGINGDFDENSVLNLYYSLDETYRQNASFVTNKDVVHKIRMLKDNNGRYLYNPSLSTNSGDTLLGIEVFQSKFIPAISNGNKALIVGDFSAGYQIVDRTGIKILRDPFTAKPFTLFFATKRTGGDVVDTKAFKILKLSA